MTESKMPIKENVVAGTVGAVLFSLAGGVVWFVLYQVGYLAGISGLIGVVCAIKGYALFAKKESLKGVIIAIVSAVLVMVLTSYLCLSMDVYNAYQEWYANGEIPFTLTFAESFQNAYLFLQEGEILGAYLKDLLIGLALCALGAFRSVAEAVNRVKQERRQAQQPQEQPTTVQPQEQPTETAEQR